MAPRRYSYYALKFIWATITISPSKKDPTEGRG